MCSIKLAGSTLLASVGLLSTARASPLSPEETKILIRRIVSKSPSLRPVHVQVHQDAGTRDEGKDFEVWWEPGAEHLIDRIRHREIYLGQGLTFELLLDTHTMIIRSSPEQPLTPFHGAFSWSEQPTSPFYEILPFGYFSYPFGSAAKTSDGYTLSFSRKFQNVVSEEVRMRFDNSLSLVSLYTQGERREMVIREAGPTTRLAVRAPKSTIRLQHWSLTWERLSRGFSNGQYYPTKVRTSSDGKDHPVIQVHAEFFSPASEQLLPKLIQPRLVVIDHRFGIDVHWTQAMLSKAFKGRRNITGRELAIKSQEILKPIIERQKRAIAAQRSELVEEAAEERRFPPEVRQALLYGGVFLVFLIAFIISAARTLKRERDF